jgi:hypothetical protein
MGENDDLDDLDFGAADPNRTESDKPHRIRNAVTWAAEWRDVFTATWREAKAQVKDAMRKRRDGGPR